MAFGVLIIILGVGARQFSKSSSFFSVGVDGLAYGVATGEFFNFFRYALSDFEPVFYAV